MNQYTDPETGRTWTTTEDQQRQPTPAQQRATAEAHILATRGEISDRNRELLDETYPIPKFEDVGQGIINKPEHLDLARFNDHAYWLTHKSEFETAIRSGSFN